MGLEVFEELGPVGVGPVVELGSIERLLVAVFSEKVRELESRRDGMNPRLPLADKVLSSKVNFV